MDSARATRTPPAGYVLLAMMSIGIALPAFPTSAAEQHELAVRDFQTYCASCHGVTGEGDGPVAPELKVSPPDLTRIADRNGGTFPGEEVYKKVFGLDMPAAHGTREMPVWGFWFSTEEIAESLNTGDETPPLDRVDKRIRGIAAYLESIQK